MNSFFKISLFSIIYLSFIACFDSSNNVDGVNKFIEGKVIDGYIKNARVCLDTNKNNKCDNSEPSTFSNSNGYFKFKTNDSGEFNILMENGIDTATNAKFTGTLKKAIELNDTNETITTNITPISTIIANIKESNQSLSIKETQNIVSNKFNLPINTINDNPILNKKLFSISQQLIQSTQLLANYIDNNQ